MRHKESSPESLVPAFAEVSEGLRSLAYKRFPEGVLVPQGTDDGWQAVEFTKRLLAEGQEVLFGATFEWRGILAVVDVLIQRKGKWYAYLVRPSTRVKEWHLTDAALHEHILGEAGVLLADISLLLLNMRYVRRGDLSPEELFIDERVGKRLLKQKPFIRGRAQMLKRMAAKKASRKVAASDTPVLAFREEAVAAITNESLTVDNLPPQVEVDKDAVKAFLESLQYPLYFMDFEAYQTAIPEYDGHWPFRQLPFQFSVHRVDHPGGELHHHAFIAPVNTEPTTVFGTALLQATGEEGSVLVYNIDSEKLVLDQLEGDHPQWTNAIGRLRSRLVDLMLPFSKQAIRIPAIGNKLSLKYVLPVMVPQMSYSLLTIGNGDEANQAYNAIRASGDMDFIEKTRQALFAYAEVDTLAMVRILERMRELVREEPQ